MDREVRMIEAMIHSLGVDQDTDQPVVVLRSTVDGRVLPIWIGNAEATAILLHVQDVHPPRPMTHDLLLAAIRALGYQVERIEIPDLRETTFYANIVVTDGTGTLGIDARPSDSIALAVRAGCPIFISEDVMEQAGRQPMEEVELEPEEEVERFREFLDRVTPEDFGSRS
jgi:bifunctional DNase/RNase